MSTPQRQRIPLPLLVLAAVGGAVSLVRALIPASRTGQWEWVFLGLYAIVLVGMLTYLVKFVRRQRDDYWRERGKVPKHPEI
jgi:uncharacterized membrane protein